MKKVLMIVGSMRKKSFNRQLANEIERIIGDRAEVSYLEYSDLPYMNQDIEFPAPESVARVREEIKDTDGIWICSPEYNYNIPGGLKNLLDWLSRPLVKNDWVTASAVKGKLVTISGAAGKSGAEGVRSSLKRLLERMGMNVACGEGTGIVLDETAFMTGTVSFTDAVKEELEKQASDFLKEMNK